MANTLVNLARVVSTTTGTGTLTLGSAVTGFNTFANAGLTDGQTVTYAIEDYSSDTPATVIGREIGTGVYSSAGPSLTRATVYSSTLGGSKINCSGRQHVFITAAAEDLASFATDLTAHLADTSDAHDASAISFSATGGISSTDVQAAIAELDSEKLSTADAASTYQPLDADLTSIAALTTAAYGRGLLETTSEANFKATVNLEIGTDVQAYDAELAAIAGLTSAADRLPYFTGSGTAALATYTAFARTLDDDADAATARTTLGLGTGDSPQFTAVNVGHASDTTITRAAAGVLLCEGSVLTTEARNNTFTAVQTISGTTDFFNSLVLRNVNNSANPGPYAQFYRDSASPAANDQLGQFLFRGRDSGGNVHDYAQFGAAILDPTDASEDGEVFFYTTVAGASSVRMRIANGVQIGAPTGGYRGVGTLNATAVYDDSVLLCAPVEFMKSGTVNTAMWDQYAIDVTSPDVVSTTEDFVEIALDVPEYTAVAQKDGTYKRVEVTTKRVPVTDEKPVLNDSGEVVGTIKAPRVARTVTPGRTIKRQNELAHEFKAMLDEGFDPRDPKAYFDKMLADEALPGLKTKANWVPNEESNAKRTNRIILALELQTAAFKTVYEQVEALKAEVESLKKARR